MLEPIRCGALIVTLALSVGCNDNRATRIQTELSEQQKQIREIQTKLSSLAKSGTLDLDEKCAKQAREEFHAAGYKEDSFNSFTNHYNPELGKCLIFIQGMDMKTTKGRIWTTKGLWDAYERKNYGSFSWLSDPSKQYSDVKPVECHVFTPSGEKKICRSEAEFDELVKTYMGRGGQ